MKKIIALILMLSLTVAAYFAFKTKKEIPEEIIVEKGPFLVTISASGTVGPENKISISAPIAGRIDSIKAEEGIKVKKGQVLAWMSSTDRAALLDSAKTQGEAAIGDLAEVYRATPILSPVSGRIIAKNIVVGQTVSSSTTLFELSDRLVVVADVDETDLGKIRLGQIANVTVDSFPGLRVNTKVVRIAHQSKIKNSINVYEVLLLPETLPDEFRSGLTATVQFSFKEKADALQIPTWVAEGRENFSTKIQMKDGSQRTVEFGYSNGEKIEIISGLNQNEILLVPKQKILGEKPATVFGVGSGGGRRR